MRAADDYVSIFPAHREAEQRRYPTHDWRDGLILSDKKVPKALLANVLHALCEADEWAGVLAYDTFTAKITLAMPPPWHDHSLPWRTRAWSDPDNVRATEWMQRNGICAGLDVVSSAIENAARENETHAVRAYLAKLKWDSKPRLDTWLSTYLGADRSPLMTAFGRGFLVGAVARVMDPGAKVDTTLVLEGKQGVGKSRALAVLGGDLYTDDVADLGSKEAAIQLAGKWIVELSELDAMSKVEATRTKAFLSRTFDHYWPPYGRVAIDVARQCVFAGTTNADAWQRDETGGRRFWPVRVGVLDLAALKRDRDQLWAEAVHAHAQGAKWWLEDEALLAEAEEEQAARYQGDAWDEDVRRYVESRQSVTTREVMGECLMIETAKRDKAAEMRIGRILATLGFHRRQRRSGGARVHYYERE